jgi:hypothetical protein
MRRLTIGCGLGLALALGAGSVHAADDFTGFYQAIDPVDGSLDHMSITPNRDGSYDILVSSSGLRICDEGRKRGFIAATGRVVNKQLVRESVVATCVESGETTELDDGSYSRSREGKLLSIDAPGGDTVRYHRLSN